MMQITIKQVYNYFVYSIGILILLPLNMQGQQVQYIDLETILELGGANNLTILAYKQKQELAHAELTKTREWWLPNIYAGVQTNQLVGAAMNTDGRFALDLDRGNLWTGIGLDATWDFGKGIYQNKAAKYRAEAASYLSKAEQNKSLLEMINAYYDFAASQMNYQAYSKLHKQSEGISQEVDVQVEVGLRYESEALLAKSNVNHLKVKMLGAKAVFGKQSANLVQLLNLDPKTKLVNLDSIIMPLDVIMEDVVDYESSYSLRPESKVIDWQRKALEEGRKEKTWGLLFPDLSINTNASYFGALSGDVVPLAPATDLKQLYSTSILNSSLLWQLPLGQIFYRGDVKRFDAQIKLKEIQSAQLKAQINQEILTAISALEVAKEQLTLAKEGSQFANEALQQSIQRQSLGTAKPYELIQVQELFIMSQLDYIQVVTDYNKAYYALKVAKGESL